MKRHRRVKLFPLFVKLTGRPCLVVGAGSIGESKIFGLLEAGARVTVVAPQATADIQSQAWGKKIVWRRRAFRPADLKGAFLVVAATSSTKLHEQIFRQARGLGVLCNVVDVPHLCDFYYPAVVRRGALQIAISTSGESPALAQRLRKELEVQFGAEYENWVESIGAAREKIKTRQLDAGERKKHLHEMAGRTAFEEFRAARKRKPARRRSTKA
jgi:precorrin-2 dehydrogenase / sirohydrochlorin ferrochelatase